MRSALIALLIMAAVSTV
jgi:hypothetical protein